MNKELQIRLAKAEHDAARIKLYIAFEDGGSLTDAFKECDRLAHKIDVLEGRITH